MNLPCEEARVISWCTMRYKGSCLIWKVIFCHAVLLHASYQSFRIPHLTNWDGIYDLANQTPSLFLLMEWWTWWKQSAVEKSIKGDLRVIMKMRHHQCFCLLRQRNVNWKVNNWPLLCTVHTDWCSHSGWEGVKNSNSKSAVHSLWKWDITIVFAFSAINASDSKEEK